MDQTSSTASPEAVRTSSSSHPPFPMVQRAPDRAIGGDSSFAQRAVNAVGGGSPLTPPASFTSLLNYSQGSSLTQAGVLQQLQHGYGNSYVGRVIQRKCECGGTCAECSEKAQEIEKKLQRQGEGTLSSLPESVTPAIQLSGQGNPLPPGVRSSMESRFGQDFSEVRVHEDSSAGAAARDLKAQAFTTGRDIYFAPGRFQPHTSEGEKLLAHELTHVV